MDELFLDLIGKPSLKEPKIITVISENFTLLEDQAQFLKATLAIPAVKKLPFRESTQSLIQIGLLPSHIRQLLEREKWTIYDHEIDAQNICAKIEEDVRSLSECSIIYLNDLSRFELSRKKPKETRSMLALLNKMKNRMGHFVVVLYQNTPDKQGRTLRDLKYLSDVVVSVRSCNSGYHQSLMYPKEPAIQTLMPARVETSYYFCKIGRSFWSEELLCFHEREKVTKDYELMQSVPTEIPTEAYIPAQTPARNVTAEEARIFFYPDKDDCIDEEDEDSDLAL